MHDCIECEKYGQSVSCWRAGAQIATECSCCTDLWRADRACCLCKCRQQFFELPQFHLLVGNARTNSDGVVAVDLPCAQLFNASQCNDIDWFDMIEVDLDHEVGATLDESCIWGTRQFIECLSERQRHSNGHFTPSQSENVSIIALTSPSGYKIGQVAPLSM